MSEQLVGLGIAHISIGACVSRRGVSSKAPRP